MSRHGRRGATPRRLYWTIPNVRQTHRHIICLEPTRPLRVKRCVRDVKQVFVVMLAFGATVTCAYVNDCCCCCCCCCWCWPSVGRPCRGRPSTRRARVSGGPCAPFACTPWRVTIAKRPAPGLGCCPCNCTTGVTRLDCFVV
eukprot:scaffold4286_cov92-Amphora_coffeaeformis.AAC.1